MYLKSGKVINPLCVMLIQADDGLGDTKYQVRFSDGSYIYVNLEEATTLRQLISRMEVAIEKIANPLTRF